MSLEGIREAYASIYNNQEQEVLDENVLNYLGTNLKGSADWRFHWKSSEMLDLWNFWGL